MNKTKSLSKNIQIHASAIVDDGAVIGEGTRIWHFSHVSEKAIIGQNCSIGQNVYIANVSIGDNVKIQNNVSVYEGVELCDDVFCGPSVVFTNVYNPRSEVNRKNQYRKTIINKGASIGANATIVCGVTIGKYAFIGAGSTVTKDVSDYALVVGNPAKQIGWMSQDGARLEFNDTNEATCPLTSDVYLKDENGLVYKKPQQESTNYIEKPFSIEFIDLKRQYSLIEPSITRNISKVLNHGQYILGPEVFELEKKLAQRVGVEHCITVSSGTDALLISLMALGIGQGDEVITTPFTFAATVEVIKLVGATPVFVDINWDDYLINARLIEKAVTPNTKAVIPVSLYGQMPDMVTIEAIANKYGLAVIEDGAQSFGASQNGRQSCGVGTMGCTSFFPSKPLGCYGDGGAVFTNDSSLAKTIKELRVHGQSKRYTHTSVGLAARMDTLQCAVVLAKLEVFDKELEARHQIADNYSRYLKTAVGENLKLTKVSEGNQCVWGQYTVGVLNRDKVIDSLNRYRVPYAIHYPMPMHKQLAYSQDVSMPNSEIAADTVLSLPMSPYLTDNDQKYIVQSLIRSL